MKLSLRILVALSVFSWTVFLFWMTNWMIFFALPLIGIAYIVFGGKKNV